MTSPPSKPDVMRRSVFVLITAIAMQLGHAATADDDFDFFESKIRPLLVSHCYECHSKASGKARGGLRVDTREALLRGGDTGAAVVPRSSAKSLLYQSIIYQGDCQMPPKGKLPEAVIADVRRWIDRGAPDPRATGLVSDVPSTIDIDHGRTFWAYQPPRPQTPPTVDDAWPRTAIDRFVWTRRETQGLVSAPDADARTLVRRLYFVLTGLPPSPAASEHWAGEIRLPGSGLNQRAIEALVDELLASHHYGERWGRHWMDVARYAESTGGDQNNVYPHAWRYRDYVIDSFNRDTPYDRFILEQLAGDLLPIADEREWARNIVATGFLAVGVKLVGEEDQQQYFADLVDEQIDVATRAFLGTTVACARCHDHKLAPIPQTDYYALAAIFRSTATHYGLIKAQARQASTLIDLTGMGLPSGSPPLNDEQYGALVKARDDAKRTLDEALQKIRRGENVFRGALRRMRSVRDETEAALQSYQVDGTPRVFAMGVQDREHPLPTRLLHRGDLDQPAQLVQPGVVQVLAPPNRHRTADIRLRVARIEGLPGPSYRLVSGRLELAAWIASDQNPLTARVMANRIWHWMFGQGLVRTVDDFGDSGERPTHPELLDFLALRLVENNWSVKSMIREIAQSRTWQLSSRFDEANFAVDPDNRFFWRANKRRLEGEAIRDAMLAVSGELAPDRPRGTLLREVGEGNVGQNVFEPVLRQLDFNHRSVYLPRVRNVLPEVLELFDAPDASSVAGARDATASPLQSLYMLNHDFVQTQAESLARRLSERPASERLDFAYLLLLGRLPNDDERDYAKAFMIQLGEATRLSKDEKLAAYCQALMCTTEFAAID